MGYLRFLGWLADGVVLGVVLVRLRFLRQCLHVGSLVLVSLVSSGLSHVGKEEGGEGGKSLAALVSILGQ